MNSYASVPGLLAAALVSGAVLADEAAASKAGEILVSQAGMTLYQFDKDMAGNGKSVCMETCAELWPPLQAAAGASVGGDYAVIVRDDGRRQWTYKGKPLYLYSKDKQAGERNGDNFKEIWHVIKN
ncbi:MAG: hypothetical protein HYZ65_15765 [Burkholderiales bacterium]|nr:hypothetical protein [Burkholderiales bacterium]